jgi:glycosyltransferase involved in cell wall biosynthesis
MRVLFLGDIQHPNSQNWVSALRKYGGCQVETWSLPWPSGVIGKFRRIIAFAIAPLSIRLRILFFKPDIVIGYRVTSYGFLAALTGSKNVVIASQGESDVNSAFQKKNTLQYKVKEGMARYAIRKAKLIHVWSNHMAKSIYDLGSDRSKVLVLHRGVDFENFNVSSKKLNNSLVIIVTRSLFPEYRHNIIIEAMALLKERKIPFSLKIIGSGKDEIQLKEMVAKLNLNNDIKFYGRLNNKTIVEEFEKSNVYVAMPITEGVSASLVEAMACYCIPVVTDLEANRLFIENNKNGYLINIDDTQQLANTLGDIWNKLNEFEEILKDNRALVENYSSQEKNMKVFVSEYHKIMNRVD